MNSTLSLYDIVLYPPTNRIGVIIGLGQLVGDIRIQFTDGSYDVKVEKVKVLVPSKEAKALAKHIPTK